MEGVDVLETIAEVSIAFAGFTSVVAVLGRRAGGDWSEVDLFRLSQMLTSSLSALLFAFLPILLVYLGVPTRLSWAASSGFLAVFLGSHFLIGSLKIRTFAAGDLSVRLLPTGAMITAGFTLSRHFSSPVCSSCSGVEPQLPRRVPVSGM